MAPDPIEEIQKQLRRVQEKIEASGGDLIADLREAAKTDSGRLTEFGRKFIAIAKEDNLKQSFVAKLLGISAGAVSQHYNKG